MSLLLSQITFERNYEDIETLVIDDPDLLDIIGTKVCEIPTAFKRTSAEAPILHIYSTIERDHYLMHFYLNVGRKQDGTIYGTIQDIHKMGEALPKCLKLKGRHIVALALAIFKKLGVSVVHINADLAVYEMVTRDEVLRYYLSQKLLYLNGQTYYEMFGFKFEASCPHLKLIYPTQMEFQDARNRILNRILSIKASDVLAEFGGDGTIKELKRSYYCNVLSRAHDVDRALNDVDIKLWKSHISTIKELTVDNIPFCILIATQMSPRNYAKFDQFYLEGKFYINNADNMPKFTEFIDLSRQLRYLLKNSKGSLFLDVSYQ